MSATFDAAVPAASNKRYNNAVQKLVEPGGIEPPSASPPQAALHA